MNPVETKMDSLGHLRFSFDKGRYCWFALQAGVVDFKYRFIRDLEALNRTTTQIQTPVAIFVDGDESKTLLGTVMQFPRWKTLMVGARGLATEKPMTVCAKTASVVIAYGERDWCSALQDEVNSIENGPDFFRRDMKAVEVERQPMGMEADPNGRFKGDVERLRHWWRTPAVGLQVRDMIDMRPQFRV